MTPAEVARAARAADTATLERVARLLAREPMAGAVSTPAGLAGVLYGLLAGREREAVAVVALDRRLRPIDAAVISEGTDAACIVDPRTVLRWALTRSRCPYAIALGHNHPSGDPTPSPQDIEVTTRLVRAAHTVGVDVVDHLVVTDDPAAWSSIAGRYGITRLHGGVSFAGEAHGYKR